MKTAILFIFSTPTGSCDALGCSGEVCGWIPNAQLCLLLTAITAAILRGKRNHCWCSPVQNPFFLDPGNAAVINSSLSCFGGPVYWRNWLRSFIWRAERLNWKQNLGSVPHSICQMCPDAAASSSLTTIPSLPLTSWGCTEDLGALFSSISHSKATGFPMEELPCPILIILASRRSLSNYLNLQGSVAVPDLNFKIQIHLGIVDWWLTSKMLSLFKQISAVTQGQHTGLTTPSPPAPVTTALVWGCLTGQLKESHQTLTMKNTLELFSVEII